MVSVESQAEQPATGSASAAPVAKPQAPPLPACAATGGRAACQPVAPTRGTEPALEPKAPPAPAA
eukprot:4866803-Alexandrium_andersonii.AAC.1